MNGSKTLITEYTQKQSQFKNPNSVILALPFPYLSFSLPFQTAAQTISNKKSGAFTGEVSASMLLDLDIKWTLVGHSERREIFKESNELLFEKVELAVDSGLNVIYCVGETLAQRDANMIADVITSQLTLLKKLSVEQWKKIVIAYEPVWAIGTGKVASPVQVQDAHVLIRGMLSEIHLDVGLETRILYGGSVNGGNCVELSLLDDVDGFLVGGASLKVDEFIKICNCRD